MPLIVITVLMELLMILEPSGGAGRAAEDYFIAICIAKLIPVKMQNKGLQLLIFFWIPFQLLIMVVRLADGMRMLSIALLIGAWCTSGNRGPARLVDLPALLDSHRISDGTGTAPTNLGTILADEEPALFFDYSDKYRITRSRDAQMDQIYLAGRASCRTK